MHPLRAAVLVAALAITPFAATAQDARPAGAEKKPTLLRRVPAGAAATRASATAPPMAPAVADAFKDLLKASREDFASRLAALDALLNTPGLHEDLAQGPGWMGFRGMFAFAIQPDTVEARRDELLALTTHAPERFHAVQATGLADLYDALRDAAGDLSAAADERRRIEPLRLAAIAALRSALDSDPGLADDQRDLFTSRIARFESPASRGELIGSPAPEIPFHWTSDGLNAGALSDLRGKVVVLDFWAYWCQPCVAKFPEMRRLREQYDPDDVAILGLTELQGLFPVEKKLQKLEPREETAAMPAYMAHRDMTWDVAFTESPLFDPRFGVAGIPHLTIIDRAGNVRWNGVAPDDLHLITALLDELVAKK